MKSKIFKLVVFFSFLAFAAFSQNKYNSTNVDFSIDGTSNVHDWTSKATGGSFTGFFEIENNEIVAASDVVVSLPVKNIKSDNGSIMDNKTYGALKSDKFKNITYKLNSVQNISGSGSQCILSTSGTLTIAGSSKSINMDVKCNVTSSGEIIIEGSKALKMTDFKVDPPTAMFGAMTTGNDVTVSFKSKLYAQ